MTPTMTVMLLDADLARLRSEFLLYPGMCLTVEQVARLLGVRRDEAVRLLAGLEDDGLVVRWANGNYRRASPLLA